MKKLIDNEYIDNSIIDEKLKIRRIHNENDIYIFFLFITFNIIIK